MHPEYKLIQAQELYIKFLEDEIKRTHVFLHIHKMDCNSKTIQQGVFLRDKITKAKSLIK